MPSVSQEIRVLTRFAAPLVATQVGFMTMGVVDVWMVGRLGRDALASVALGDLWVVGTFIVGMGILLGADPIISQAHGAGDGRTVALTLQRGITLGIALSLPVSLTWLYAEEFLVAIGQQPILAHQAEVYIDAQIFSLPPYYLFIVLRQYLQCRGIMMPTLWVILFANGLNVLLNWVLIFGNLGFPALGIVGAGLATGFTRTMMPAALALWIVYFRLHRGAWVPWSIDVFRIRGFTQIAFYGFPVAVQIGLEVWAFSFAALIAGTLGPSQLASHLIVVRLATLSFMMPLGISIASVTRVGNLIGAGHSRQAQLAAWVALSMAASVMTLSALVFVFGRQWLPLQFTTDSDVVALSAAILPVAAAFQLFDGTQVVGCGVLRGMGNTLPAALFNLLGYYLLALPLGWCLAFPLGLGLQGIWWGLCLGLGTVALMLIAWIWRKGPAFASRLPRNER